MKNFVIYVGIMMGCVAAIGQTAVNMGSVKSITGCDFIIYDDGGPNGDYGKNRSDTLTIYPAPGQSAVYITFLGGTDIDASDTLFCINGPSANHPNNQQHPLYVGALGTSWVNASSGVYPGTAFSAIGAAGGGAITLIFKSDGAVEKSGFKLQVKCGPACQQVVLEFDAAAAFPPPKYEWDTTQHVPDPCSENVANAREWAYIDLCPGKIPHFAVKCRFPDNDAFYHQSMDSTKITWDLGIGSRGVYSGYGLSEIDPVITEVKGYTLSITAKDHKSCLATNSVSVRIRVSAPDLIQRVEPFRSICQGDTAIVSMGTDLNASLIVKPVILDQITSLAVNDITLIPDGDVCGQPCYDAPVTFTTFSAGDVMEYPSDIISVCINMEHSYSGDIDIFLKCPSGKLAQLVARTGTSTFYGLAYDDPGNTCLPGPQGIGWNYCWTQNDCISHYTNNVTSHSNSQFLPTGFPSGPSHAVWDSSWRYSNPPSHYYTPLESFSKLIGCPMNGTWAIHICDQLPSDDGWVFNWELQLSPRFMRDWSYNIVPSSLTFSGQDMYVIDTNHVGIAPKETVGLIPFGLSVVDNLGCPHDTVAWLQVHTRPHIEPISNEKSMLLCTGQMFQIGVTDTTSNVGFYWNTGATTPIISVVTGGQYALEATTYHEDSLLRCVEKYAVTVVNNPTPFIDFEVEGDEKCVPATVTLVDKTIYDTELDADFAKAVEYQWYVWDEDWHLYFSSTEKSPTFLFETAGSYHVMLSIGTPKGCRDSLIKYRFVNIYSTPAAEFLATPESQMLSDGGEVFFLNFVDSLILKDKKTNWYWDFGDGIKDSSDFSLTHKYDTWGDYDVMLYVMTEHGCTDQIVHRVTIDADLEFANIITPNGDGLNDVFAIKNLNTNIDPNDPNQFRENLLTIYNRYGKKVYEAKNYDTYMKGEELVVGQKAFSGDGCADGTYYYTFYYKGKLKTSQLNGTLMIIRENK